MAKRHKRAVQESGQPSRARKVWGWIGKIFGTLLLTGFIALLIFACIFAVYIKNDLSHQVDFSVEGFALDQTSVIYYQDRETGEWKELKKLYQSENRIWVGLEDIRWVTARAREHPQEFAAYISGKQSAELQREIRRREKELTALNQRARELDAIFKRLYEDSVLGRITAEQFQTLSGSYTEEMAALKGKIPGCEAAIQALREQVCGADHFIALAKKYTDIRELTPELLRLFIRKIVVHEKDVKWSKHSRQTVEIHYNDIGCVDTQADEAKSGLESA